MSKIDDIRKSHNERGMVFCCDCAYFGYDIFYIASNFEVCACDQNIRLDYKGDAVYKRKPKDINENLQCKYYKKKEQHHD